MSVTLWNVIITAGISITSLLRARACIIGDMWLILTMRRACYVTYTCAIDMSERDHSKELARLRKQRQRDRDDQERTCEQVRLHQKASRACETDRWKSSWLEAMRDNAVGNRTREGSQERSSRLLAIAAVEGPVYTQVLTQGPSFWIAVLWRHHSVHPLLSKSTANDTYSLAIAKDFGTAKQAYLAINLYISYIFLAIITVISYWLATMKVTQYDHDTHNACMRP